MFCIITPPQPTTLNVKGSYTSRYQLDVTRSVCCKSIAANYSYFGGIIPILWPVEVGNTPLIPLFSIGISMLKYTKSLKIPTFCFIHSDYLSQKVGSYAYNIYFYRVKHFHIYTSMDPFATSCKHMFVAICGIEFKFVIWSL